MYNRNYNVQKNEICYYNNIKDLNLEYCKNGYSN